MGGDELMRELIPLNGTSILVKGIPRALLSLPPCEDRVKGGEPGSRTLSDTEFAGVLI